LKQRSIRKNKQGNKGKGSKRRGEEGNSGKSPTEGGGVVTSTYFPDGRKETRLEEGVKGKKFRLHRKNAQKSEGSQFMRPKHE